MGGGGSRGGVSSRAASHDNHDVDCGNSTGRKSRHSRHSLDSIHSFISSCQEAISHNSIPMPPLLLHLFDGSNSNRSSLRSTSTPNCGGGGGGTSSDTTGRRDYDVDIKLTCSAIMNITTKSQETVTGRKERIRQLFYDIVKMATKAEQFLNRSVLNEVLATIKALEKLNLCIEDEWTEQTRALVSLIEDKTVTVGPPTFVRQMSLNSLNASRMSTHRTFHKMISALPSMDKIHNENNKPSDSCDDYGLGYGLDESERFDDSEKEPKESTKMMHESSDPSLPIVPSFRGLGNQPMYVASQLSTMA